MNIREKQNDLDNLIQNLEMTIKETDIKEVKEELNRILDCVKEDFEEVDKELEQMELVETRQELAQRYGEYWNSQF